jgi:histidinol-phosphatase (PHP family)
MKVDYHVHLEEGPYSFQWLERTARALKSFNENSQSEQGTKQWVYEQMHLLDSRLKKGCYSEEWLDLYKKQAVKMGLKEVGIVDHLYRFRETEHYFKKYMNLDSSDSIGTLQSYWLSRVMTEHMTHFTEAILDAKKGWAKDGVTLKLGIEADYFHGGEQELTDLLDGHPWDYVIGSVHFVDGWGFDNPQTAHIFQEKDAKELYTSFFETVEKMIRSGLFDFVAHLDNLKVFGFKIDDPAFNRMWHERIADALIETNTATEINAGLYYRYPVKEACPGPDFLSVLAKKGVSMTTSSDAHFPDDLGRCVDDSAKKLRDLGIQHVVSFEKRKRAVLPIT